MVHTMVRPSWASRFNSEIQLVVDELSRPLEKSREINKIYAHVEFMIAIQKCIDLLLNQKDCVPTNLYKSPAAFLGI